MLKTLSELDNKIISTAEEMFLKEGLINVEMKDIAKVVGISRSTLYRHFENSLDIAFLIAKRYVFETSEPSVSFPPNISGYEKFRLATLSLINKMLDNIHMVAFLSEFDLLYNAKSPLTERAADYDSYNHSYRSPLLSYYSEGVADGSIRDDGNGELVPRAIHHTCFAMTQRIGLRESIYLRGHHLGNELILSAVRLQLEAIKATNNND